MLDYLSTQIFKKKALDRWENEGGMLFADRTETTQNGTPDKQADIKDGACNIVQKFKKERAYQKHSSEK